MSKPDLKGSSDSQRIRAVFRLLEPWRSGDRPSQHFQSVSLSNEYSEEADTNTPVGCHDTALAAFAQLGALRLHADRAMVTLFTQDHEFVLAESSKSLSLQSDRTLDSNDALWIGTASYPRSQGLSVVVLPEWLQAKVPRQANTQYDHYHTNGITSHWFVIDDLREHPQYQSILPKFAPKIRFLCAVPITSPRGYVVGAYTVMSSKPRYGCSEEEMVFLEDMAETVANHLESRRATFQKQQADRLIKGLGVFSQGGSSLREWWLEKYDDEKQRSRRQERHESSAGLTRDQQADEEFGETTKQSPTSPIQDKEHDPTVDDQTASGREDTQGALEHTQKTDFATDHFHHDAASNDDSNQDKSADHSTQEKGFDLRSATAGVFSRASNLLRESMNVDGVVFLEAGFTRTKSKNMVARPNESIHSDSATQTSSTSASSEISDPDGVTDAIMREVSTPSQDSSQSKQRRKRRQMQDKKHTSSCEPLGYSTRTGSSTRNFAVPQRYLSFPQSRMEKLLELYPHGKLFNFADDGTTDTSSGYEGGVPDMPAKIYSDGTQASGRKGSKRVLEAQMLSRLCDDARTIALVPVWDPHRDKWRAGALVWSTTPGRHFTDDEDLNYLTSFANNITSSLLQLDMLASDQAKATFISMMSHELRSPLHGVLAGAEYLLETELNQVQREMADTVKLAGSALLDTINAILDFTKINAFSKTAKSQPRATLSRDHSGDDRDLGSSNADLAVLTENVVNTIVAGQQYRARSRAKYTNTTPQTSQLTQVPPDIPVQVILSVIHRSNWHTDIDSGAWVRILTNLVGNALKYTSEGYVHVKLEPREKSVTLAIQDTGSGISEEYQKHHMYTAFKQENPLTSGTGLGLFMVKHLVTDMGGNIVFESRTDATHGTKVLITVPVGWRADQTSENLNPVLTASTPSGSHLTVAMLRAPRSRRGSRNQEIRTVRDEMIRASVRNTCQNGLGLAFQVVERVEDVEKSDICVMTQSDYMSWRANSDKQRSKSDNLSRILVLTERFSTDYRQHDPLHDGFVFVPVDPPFGPGKISRALTEVLSADGHRKNRKQKPQTYNSGKGDSTMTDDIVLQGPQERRSLTQSTIQPFGNMKTNSKKILLVEDNDLNMRILVAWSQKLNQDFEQASNGLEAVHAYSANPSTFGLVLMDISMPVMDGFAATREIRIFETRNKLRRCKIVALTGVASEDARNDAEAAGIDEFFVKPASLARMKQLIKSMNEEVRH
ncbi:Hybrid signal transduction protein dokA [Elsinoe australis]|uniref:Hybrid signal transduction protein dokA n=1 Tax=Elsinoe australis TaxID=40998 RepID=A0A2P7YNG2_9PEZI|nr:Hybrid signal transduction protein dokA [Elsinoe australis]